MEEQVLCLAKIAQESGIDGVVCSPMEAGLIRNAMGKNFIIVTPGIRFEDMKDDQKRALSPSEIKDAGVNYIVVGRPVLKAENPVEVVKKILHSLK
jgi:orotidine-5'-phosphate decarboxylase